MTVPPTDEQPHPPGPPLQTGQTGEPGAAPTVEPRPLRVLPVEESAFPAPQPPVAGAPAEGPLAQAAPAQAAPAEGVPVLSYAVPGTGRTASVASCANAAEAEMIASELMGSGITAQVVDHNTEVLGPYAGGAAVKVLVLAEDLERAREVLRLNASDEVEPLEEPEGPDGQPDAPPPVDEEGQPLRLVVAAAFDHPRRLREAATLLAAARVQPFLPTLVARGERPPGEGKRFLLRVRREDLERAEAVLEDAEAEASEDDEPRCPRCRSWRVFKQTSLLREVGRFFGFGPAGGDEYECLACRHRGGEGEFVSRRG